MVAPSYSGVGKLVGRFAVNVCRKFFSGLIADGPVVCQIEDAGVEVVMSVFHQCGGFARASLGLNDKARSFVLSDQRLLWCVTRKLLHEAPYDKHIWSVMRFFCVERNVLTRFSSRGRDTSQSKSVHQSGALP